MKLIVLMFATLFSAQAMASDSICFDDNNAFGTQAPKGWVADFNKAKQLGLCVIYYVEGYDFNSSPAVIYPNLLSSEEQGENAIKEMIAYNTKRLRARGAPKLKVVEKSKITNPHGLEFHFRYFSNGPAPQEFEALAYHAGNKVVLLSVFSARSLKAFEAHKKKLEEFAMDIRPVSREEVKKYKSNRK